MRKKIILSLLLFVLAIPCFVLAGCGQSESFKYDIKNAQGMHFIFPGTYSTESGAIKSGNGYAEKGGSVKYELVVSNAHDVSSLKVYNNGKEVSWTKYDSYNSNCEIDENTYQLVGYVEIENVSEEVNLSASLNYRTVNFKFEIKDGGSLSEEDKAKLKDWNINSSSTLYDAVSNENYVLSLSYGELKTGIKLSTNKKIGYYYLGYGEECFIEDGAISVDWTKEKNSYNLSFNKGLNENNTVSIVPKNLFVDKVYIINQTGNSISVSSTDVKDIDSASSLGIGADSKGTVRITLKEIAGVDYSNAKLYINETNLGNPSVDSSTGEKYWEFSASKCPIEYAIFKDGENYDDKSLFASNYVLSLVGLNFLQDAEVSKISITAESKDELDKPAISYDWDSGVYYYDLDKTVYVPTECSTFATYLYLNNYMLGPKPDCITIIKNGNQESKIVISIADHIQELNEKGSVTVNGIKIAAEAFSDEFSIGDIYSYYIMIPIEKANFEINFGYLN